MLFQRQTLEWLSEQTLCKGNDVLACVRAMVLLIT